MAHSPTIRVEEISKWRGNVVSVSGISFDIYPGVTGLLGPNGAGKTTLLHMIAGLAAPSSGSVKILGQEVRHSPDIYKHLGVMPEHDTLYTFMTGREFVEFSAQLHNLPDLRTAVDKAIEVVDLGNAQHRKVGTYSRGMRQRIRLAAAIVHDPEVLILDEPLNGADPRQRLGFNELVTGWGSSGKTVLVSSHILEEVEEISESVLLVVSGKLAAMGDFYSIRELLNDRPYKIRVVTSKPRELAAALVGVEAVQSVILEDTTGSIEITTHNVKELQVAVAQLAKQLNCQLRRVEPLDESLESVFSYVVSR